MDRFNRNQNQGANAVDYRPGFTGRVTRLAARYPWRVLAAWLFLVVAAFGASGTMNVSSNTETAGTEATTAANLIKERLREHTPPEEFIVVESASSTSGDAAFSGFVDSLVIAAKALSQSSR
jgi:uncharacterized membrane protein YdfJ with MMPL/SSD domain